MPSRWAELDTDLERLPEGMVCIGYDADEQTYYYRDRDGSVWEGFPGTSRGTPARRVSWPGYGAATEAPDTPLTASEAESQLRRKELQQAKGGELTWRGEMMPLLNFFVIVGAFVLVLMYFISRPGQVDTSSEGLDIHTEQQEVRTCLMGTVPYKIQDGDTCWRIAEAHGMEMVTLLDLNEGIVCDTLEIGQVVCVPDQ